MEGLSKEELTIFLGKQRGRGQELLALLNRQKKFHDAINSDVGRELLSDLIGIMDNRLQKIVEEKATPQELAEYRVARLLLSAWEKRFSEYLQNLGKVKKVVYSGITIKEGGTPQ